MIVTDNFDRANGDLGTNWTRMAADAGTLNILSGQVIGTAGGVQSGAVRTAETFTNNQSSTIENSGVAMPSGSWMGVGVRCTNNGQDMYLGIYFFDAPNYVMQIYRRGGGVYTLLFGGGVTIGAAQDPAGVPYKLEAEGTNIRFLRAGVIRVSGVDATLTSGAPTIAAFGAATFDNWTGADDSVAADYLIQPVIYGRGAM